MASFRKLTIIFTLIMGLSFIAISYQPIREYFLASQTTQGVQSETNFFGQEFVKSLVDNSLTQEELIELNKRVSEHSTLEDTAPTLLRLARKMMKIRLKMGMEDEERTIFIKSCIS